MQNQDWINDERLDTISTEKKEFLHEILFEMNQLSSKEKLPFIMALLSSGRLNAISFSDEELKLIIHVLKDYTDEKEFTRFQGILQMLRH